MTTPSVEASHPPTQADLLGEYWPTKHIRLTLHDRPDGAALFRHRQPGNSSPQPDVAARYTSADGMVRWDEFHRKHRPVWMPTVEDWIRDTLEAS